MPDTNSEKDLFAEEWMVLESALNDINNEENKTNKLFGNYHDLTMSYRKLLKLTGKIFKISDAQGKELQRRETATKNILDNLNQGVLTFTKNLLVNREYSAECVRIFNQKIANVHILELLSVQDTEHSGIFSNIFKEIFKLTDSNEQSALLERLPKVVRINDKYINVKYRFINKNADNIDADTMMLFFTDITDIHNANDQVLYLSYHDKLTSLYNRAYIDSVIPQLTLSSNMPLSIIIADMNGLKLTNDVFGHETGDKLLVSFANVLLGCCRKNDIITRWGGDEFLIFLPATDKSACEKVCQRIKENCKCIKPDPIEISASLGMATTENVSADGISSLFSVAENIMYNHKLAESETVRKNIISSISESLQTKYYKDYDHIERLRSSTLRFSDILDDRSKDRT